MPVSHAIYMMDNDQYNHTIVKDGKQYRYDPDYDCFYRIYTGEDYANLPHWEKYGWLWVTLACTIIAAIVTYAK